MDNETHLAEILCGPILRHVSQHKIVVWLVTSSDQLIELSCYQGNSKLASKSFKANHSGYVCLGKHAHLHLLTLASDYGLPQDTWLNYDVGIVGNDETYWLAKTCPHLFYSETPSGVTSRPDFIIKSRADNIVHGSSRKPHDRGVDGLLLLDDVLAEARLPNANVTDQPALLMMHGSQVYLDDVAGPMLHAIKQVVNLLDLTDETIPDIADASNLQSLYDNHQTFYGRLELLPKIDTAIAGKSIVKGSKKDIFSTINARNHLITLSEVIAMYLLVWSPVLWRYVELEVDPEKLPKPFNDIYLNELKYVREFVDGLTQVQRVLANVPVYMIFDSHDITEKWNFSRQWEENAYSNRLAKRIIGNGLIGYLLCQGWGNAPDNFSEELIETINHVCQTSDAQSHDELIEQLLNLERWHYTIPTTPKVMVLDTRTRRWRIKNSASEPSGLMNWESVMEMQNEMLDQTSIVLVSPAPIFGVKLIEAIQRIFNWMSKGEIVDSDNWMIHPEATKLILDVFRHKRAPQNFVILSGEVNYSYAYDIDLSNSSFQPKKWGQENDTAKIWQITSAGIKSSFPAQLLRTLDSWNKWVFAKYSPLNLLSRRGVDVYARKPVDNKGRYSHRHLITGNSIGRVKLNIAGEPILIESIRADNERLAFWHGDESVSSDPLIMRLNENPEALQYFSPKQLMEVQAPLTKLKRKKAVLSSNLISERMMQNALSFHQWPMQKKVDYLIKRLGLTSSGKLDEKAEQTAEADYLLTKVKTPANFPLNIKEIVICIPDSVSYEDLIQALRINPSLMSSIILIIGNDSAYRQNLHQLTRKLDNKWVAPQESEITHLLLSTTPETALAEVLSKQLSLQLLSPYRFGGGVTNESVFFGRTELISQIVNREPATYFMTGGRQVGKSSILNALLRKYADNPQVVCVYQNLSNEVVIERLAAKLKMEVTSEPEVFASQLERRIAEDGKRYIIFIDESDYFIKHEQARNYPILNVFRRLSEEGSCTFIFTGFWHLHKSMVLDYHSPIRNIGEPIYVGKLEASACVELATMPMHNMNLRWEDDALVDLLVKKCGQRANLIAIACDYIARHINVERRVITKKDLDRALVCQNMNAALSGWVTGESETEMAYERLVVYATIELEYFTLADLFSLAKKHEVSIDTQQLQHTLARMELLLILDREEGKWFYRVPLFVDFIKTDLPAVMLENEIEKLKRM